MENVSPRVVNELFLQKLATAEGIEAFKDVATNYVRTKIREVSFIRQILPPQFVTQADVHPSVQHDGVVKIVDIEPDSKAMAVNFRGDAAYTYIEGERYEIPFFMISSDNMQKTEQELLAYTMPINQVIEKNTLFDVHDQEDSAFINAIDAAIAASCKAETGIFYSDGTIKKSDFKKLFDLIDGDKLACTTILMSGTTANRLMLYPATSVGDGIASESFLKGPGGMPGVFGKRLIVSNKDDLFKSNGHEKIYAFTAPEYLGEFDILEDIKFWLKKEKNLITFANYETVGLGIGNVKSVASLDLSAA
jgi:hypothetical protein